MAMADLRGMVNAPNLDGVLITLSRVPSELLPLRFLLDCEMNFHVAKIREKCGAEQASNYERGDCLWMALTLLQPSPPPHMRHRE